MKNFKIILNIAFIATILLFTSCGNDDDAKEQISVQDLVVAIDENPTNGESIGTVQVDGSGASGFSITSQTPAGALSINPSTGELTVADATLFDFETNPVLTATVEVVGALNTGMVTINLNDLTNDNFPINGLKSFYKLNNNAIDSGSNNYDATGNNVIYEADRNSNVNSVATFNGVDTFIEFPNAARFQPLTSSTLSFWIKTSQQSRFDLFDQRTGSFATDAYNFGVIFNLQNTGDVYHAYPGYTPSNETSYTLNSTTIPDGLWHHLVFIKDTENGVMKLYIDNVEETNTTLIQDFDFIINGTLLLGKNYASSGYFEGSIDDIFIYDRAISTAEVSTLFTYAD